MAEEFACSPELVTKKLQHILARHGWYRTMIVDDPPEVDTGVSALMVAG